MANCREYGLRTLCPIRVKMGIIRRICAMEKTGLRILRCFLCWSPSATLISPKRTEHMMTIIPSVPRRPGPRVNLMNLTRREVGFRKEDQSSDLMNQSASS